VNWQDAVIPRTASVRDAIEAITASSAQICVVTDDASGLLGTITDGDIRRGLLRGIDLSACAMEIMKTSPVVAEPATSYEDLLGLMRRNVIHQIPLVSGRQLVGIVHIDDLLSTSPKHDTWVVLMAGGKGARLRPLTEDVPKPLIPVGSKPILETIIENFVTNGFKKFFVTVHYKAQSIIDYFGDGSRYGATISYIEEREPHGTAGALKLLPERPTESMIVMNGDLLTRVDFTSLIQFHEQQNAQLTMCVRNYEVEVPFGVVELNKERIARVDEKPVHSFLVNAGIYVLSPEALDLVPSGERFDMPALFDAAIDKGMMATSFPIHEYWIDVGRLEDLQQANVDFDGVFGK
jgi:dTDP-glucose pyrophosphorylase